MRITRVESRNFRCLREVDVAFGDVVALVGTNGSGKSSIIRALEFFFDQYQPDEEDRPLDKKDEPVSVALTLGGLSSDQMATYGPWLDDDGRLRVEKRFDGGTANWISQRRQIPEFANIRRMSKGSLDAYRQLQKSSEFSDLPRVSTKDEALAAMDEYEASHSEKLVAAPDDTITYGRGGGNDLSTEISLVVVPAVRDAAGDAGDARPGAFRELVAALVRPHLGFHEGLAELRDRTQESYSEVVSTPEALEGLATSINGHLDRLAPGTSAGVNLVPQQITLPEPQVQATIRESDHWGEVGRQGHGVQRAYVFALLQALAETKALREDGRALPLLVLAVEEPELYQHPVRARHLARVLRDLAQPDGDQPTQVLYATHSPCFVSVDHITDVRLARMSGDDAGTVITAVDLETAARRLEAAHGRKGWTGDTLKARLAPVVETPVGEGLFATGVVLVEGEEDRALLMAGAKQAEFDFDREGIAVLPVSGKTNLDRALVLFDGLRIPTYVLFDGDAHEKGGNKEQSSKTNRALLTLLGQRDLFDFSDTRVEQRFSCFPNNFRAAVEGDLGNDILTNAISEAQEELGFSGDQGRKSPAVLRLALANIHAQGKDSPLLARIIEAIRSSLMAPHGTS